MFDLNTITVYIDIGNSENKNILKKEWFRDLKRIDISECTKETMYFITALIL